MRKSLLTAIALAGMGFFAPGAASAAPAAAGGVLEALESSSLIQEARVFCYNRYTGRFLHWGRCARRVRHYSRPRVYCYNRRTGRFLHWGHC